MSSGPPTSSPRDDYRGLVASTWDVWRDDTANWRDRHFYLDVIHRFGQPALDIGCGTGRLILDYLSLGIDIDGVDCSREMLDICRDKAAKLGLAPAPSLYEQRIETLDLPRRYRTIVAPSSVLQLLTDPDQARAAMQRIAAHLVSGGALVASFNFEWREGEPLDTGWELLFEKRRPGDGAIVRSWTREWREPAHQLWHVEQRFEVELVGRIIDSAHHRRCPEGRWYTQPQAIELYRAAGLADVRALHEFTQDPAGPQDKLFCVLGIKP
jgi:ubiquinone/menaquinone biosynthesis C-methylase UbiE